MVERNADDWLAAKLKVEANRHEPDLDRIRQRIRDRGVDAPVRRSAWLLPAAAATFVVLTAGLITAVNSGQSSDPAGRVDVVGPARTGTAGPPTVAPTPSFTGSTGPAESTDSATSGTSGSPSAKPRKSNSNKSTDPQSTTSRTPPREVELDLVAADPDQAVVLPGDAVDWIAAGPGSAQETVRRAKGEQLISGPHETGNVTTTTTDSPFSVSWTGGMAERSHSDVKTWRTVAGPADGPETGLFLKVPVQKQESTLVLYVGAAGADGSVRTKLGTQGKVNSTRLKAVKDGGYIVTIDYHTDNADDELLVELIAGSGGSISFAAASLR